MRSFRARDVIAGLGGADRASGIVRGGPGATALRGCGAAMNLWPWFSLTREFPAPRTDYDWPPFQADRAVPTAARSRGAARAGIDFVRLPVDPGPLLAFSGEQRERLFRDCHRGRRARQRERCSVVAQSACERRDASLQFAQPRRRATAGRCSRAISPWCARWRRGSARLDPRAGRIRAGQRAAAGLRRRRLGSDAVRAAAAPRGSRRRSSRWSRPAPAAA